MTPHGKNIDIEEYETDFVQDDNCLGMEFWSPNPGLKQLETRIWTPSWNYFTLLLSQQLPVVQIIASNT